MRFARTRAYAKSIIFEVPNANASFDRSSGVSDESNAREFGPITLKTAWPDETSIAIARAEVGMWSRSHAKSRICVAAAVTIKYESIAWRVTVRSASMPPVSLSHWV